MNPSELPYRPNVAVVVVNDSGLILACRRSDHFHSWQLPQGGIEGNESPEAACLRELREEIGTDSVEILGRLPHPIRYEWPPHLHERGYRGQEQIYFLVRLLPTAAIDVGASPNPEFDHTEWLTPSQLLVRVSDFKRDAYDDALRQLQGLFPLFSSGER